MELKRFMLSEYDNDTTCQDALARLQDPAFIESNGWKEVFHEGTGNGICSPEENIVAVFDEDGLPGYHSVQFYVYDKDAWKDTANGGWDRIYKGDNGAGHEVRPVETEIH